MFRATILSFALRALSIILEFVMVLLLGRLLGPAGLGIYAFYYALVRLVSIPLTAGLPTLSIREIAQNHALERFGLMRGFIRRSAQFILVFSFLILLVGTAWLSCANFDDGDRIKIFSLILIPFIAFGNLRGAMMRGLGRAVLGQLPEYAVRPGVFALLLLAALIVFPERVDPADAMLMQLVAAMLAFIVGLFLFFHILPGQVRTAKPEYADREWAKAILPFSIISGIEILNSQAAVVVLGFHGLDADAGLFRLAQQISLVAAFPITAVALVFSPMFAKAHIRGDKEQLQELMQISTMAIFLFGFLFSAVAILFGEAIIQIFFGYGFEPSYPALVVLLIGQMFNCFTGALYPMLKMVGQEKVFAWVAGVAAGLNFLLAVLLVQDFGAMGGAISTAVSVTFISLVLGIYSFKVLKINPFPTLRAAKTLSRLVHSQTR